MTTLVKADEKGRIPLRAEPGRQYVVTRSGEEWLVSPYQPKTIRSRNRKEWEGSKSGRGLFDALGELGELGLSIEESEESKQPVPPCRLFSNT